MDPSTKELHITVGSASGITNISGFNGDWSNTIIECKCGSFGVYSEGGDGGSGGGAGYIDEKRVIIGAGGSDGSSGGDSKTYHFAIGPYASWWDTMAKGGKGQGTTTRAFGESTGTLYGGGGGGACGQATNYANVGHGGSGGAGGGGRGAGYDYHASSGSPNTGGGGGGGDYSMSRNAGLGGSGIAIVRYIDR